jgi:hypothetical protein
MPGSGSHLHAARTPPGPDVWATAHVMACTCGCLGLLVVLPCWSLALPCRAGRIAWWWTRATGSSSYCRYYTRPVMQQSRQRQLMHLQLCAACYVGFDCAVPARGLQTSSMRALRPSTAAMTNTPPVGTHTRPSQRVHVRGNSVPTSITTDIQQVLGKNVICCTT